MTGSGPLWFGLTLLGIIAAGELFVLLEWPDRWRRRKPRRKPRLPR